MSARMKAATLEDRERRELERRIAETPSEARVKGMYVEAFLHTFDQQGLPRPTKSRYLSFKDYPLTDFMRMMLDACPVLYPRSPLREALRYQGRLVYPTLSSSTVGKVIFSIAGRDWQTALKLASRGWEISIRPGTATLARLTETSAVLELRDVYNFADSYQVGVLEGAMETFRVEGTVFPQVRRRPCDVDLIMDWH